MIKVCFYLLPLGLPGGDQVDGLPPAVSLESECSCVKNLTFSKKTSTNKSVVTRASADDQSVLQPAVDRQPGHRRGDREEVGRNIP